MLSVLYKYIILPQILLRIGRLVWLIVKEKLLAQYLLLLSHHTWSVSDQQTL